MNYFNYFSSIVFSWLVYLFNIWLKSRVQIRLGTVLRILKPHGVCINRHDILPGEEVNFWLSKLHRVILHYHIRGI